MAVKDLLDYIGIKVVNETGDECQCACPICDREKFYINKQTGQCKCHRGCISSNIPGMLKQVKKMPADEIRDLTRRFNCEQHVAAPTEKKEKIGRPQIGPLILMKRDEVIDFCRLKGVDPAMMYATFGPLYRLPDEPVMVLPAFDIKRLDDPACCLIKAHMEGKMIKVGKQEAKYPVVRGSKHSLLGLRTLLKADYPEIWYTEGWRDQQALLAAGVAAVAGSGGSSKWDDDWLPVFTGKVVNVCMDADKAGQKFAKKVAAVIGNVAKRVRLVKLPYKIADANGKDTYDFMHEAAAAAGLNSLEKETVEVEDPDQMKMEFDAGEKSTGPKGD